MMKVGVMMGILKKYVDDPSILSKKLYYEAKFDPGQYFKPKHPLKSGYYSVQAATGSDDYPIRIIMPPSLWRCISKQIYTDIYTHFNYQIFLKNLNDFMSAKSFSVLFRGLYNAAYIPAPVSEQALRIADPNNFTQGIVAGLPKSVVVAHKFGEHSDELPDGTIKDRELHDCGIVYFPGNPSFVCIMTHGNDFNKLEPIIEDISQMIYKICLRIKIKK
jgi:hypothetical protein